MSAKEDLDRYHKALMANNISICLRIEDKYGLRGYPPDMVYTALNAEIDGKNMYLELDKVMGFED